MLEQRNKLALSKISVKIQARAKQWTAHLEATLKLQMQRSIDKADHGLTSLEKKLLLSIVSDTLLQLKQLMLALRGLPCVCQSLYSPLLVQWGTQHGGEQVVLILNGLSKPGIVRS